MLEKCSLVPRRRSESTWQSRVMFTITQLQVRYKVCQLDYVHLEADIGFI